METELKMTAYERQRLENVKRNADMMSSLKINSILANLSSSSFKRPRPYIKGIYEKSRSSSRTQGIPPSHPSGLPYDIQSCKSRIHSCGDRPISMRNVYMGDEDSHQLFIETLSALEMNSVNNAGRMTEKAPLRVESLKLESENVARILPKRPSVIRFLPTSDTVVIAASQSGHLGFWKVMPRAGDEDGKSVHLYHLQSGIYGISVHPFLPTKVYLSCSHGILRVMNIETEEFEVVYSSSSESSLYSLSQAPNDANSIFIGEGRGALNMYDVRAGKVMTSWLPHKERINSIDINPANTNVIATASTDGLACVWDLRKMSDQHSECKVVKAFSLERSVRSAYFSPSGSALAITSWKHDVVVLNGSSFEDVQKIHVCHGQPSLFSSAIWGWDDTYLYTGCLKRRALVLSVGQGKIARSLESSFLSSIPWQIAAHPSTVGMLAGASAMGTVSMWTGHNF